MFLYKNRYLLSDIGDCVGYCDDLTAVQDCKVFIVLVVAIRFLFLTGWNALEWPPGNGHHCLTGE